jgi:predicted Zn-dependent peptidase
MTESRFGVFLTLAAGLASAQALTELERRVTEFTLPNGMHFLVAERHAAPVVSFRTYINAGAVDTPPGQTGLARLLERLSSKGTETIGTRDFAAERKALDAVEEAYSRLEAERNKGHRADDAKITALEIQLNTAIDQAQTFVRPNEFTGAVAEGYATGSATTAGADAIQLSYSLPSNRIELWFLLESQRLSRPVFREFYKEREAQLGEIRTGTSANPQGRLLAALPAAAFEAHPYRNPLNGWPGDVERLRMTDARAFFDKYFVPGNITCAMAGDISPADARRLAERYFGPIPARQMPPPVHPAEPPQAGPRTAMVGIANQPWVAIGYKRPDANDRDDPLFDLLYIVLAVDRQSLIYRELIEQRALVSAAQVLPNYPGGRYPSLFTFLLRPAGGHSPEEVAAALSATLTRLASAPLDDATLARARAKARNNLLTRIADNSGLTEALATYSAIYGDWHKLSAELERIGLATPEEVQRVAIKYFVPEHMTMVSIVQPSAAAGIPAKEKE